MIPRFSIYYTNGEVVHGGGEDDEEITLTFSRKWLEAPSDGVTHIVGERPDIGRGLYRDCEYYYQLPLNHHGAGEYGATMKIGAFLRQLSDLGGIVKFGGWTGSSQYQQIANAANRDQWVPKQSAERKKGTLEDTAD